MAAIDERIVRFVLSQPVRGPKGDSASQRAMLDEVFVHMLATQMKHVPAKDFLSHTQGDTVKPYMRQKLADWLLEVRVCVWCVRVRVRVRVLVSECVRVL
jgi:hypothetical protein